MKLTAKQEKFAQMVAEGSSVSDAYRAAYNAGKMTAESVHREAHEVSKNPKVATRIEELRKPVVDKVQITLETHLEDLKALRNMAIKDGKVSAAISAEIARGKAAGVYIERLELRGADGGPIQHSNVPMTEDELRKELERRGLSAQLLEE